MFHYINGQLARLSKPGYKPNKKFASILSSEDELFNFLKPYRHLQTGFNKLPESVI